MGSRYSGLGCTRLSASHRHGGRSLHCGVTAPATHSLRAFSFAFCVAVLIAWGIVAPDLFPNECIEFVGLIYDILLILVFFAIFERLRQSRPDERR